jgi:hypothetical protein
MELQLLCKVLQATLDPCWTFEASIKEHLFSELILGTEFICYVEESRPLLWSTGQSSWLQNGDVLFPVRHELNLYMLCRRK